MIRLGVGVVSAAAVVFGAVVLWVRWRVAVVTVRGVSMVPTLREGETIRLAPRSRQTRTLLADHTGTGAVPLILAKACLDLKREAPAASPDHRRADRAEAGDGEQVRPELFDQRVEFAFQGVDRRGGFSAADDKFPGVPGDVPSRLDVLRAVVKDMKPP
jgi:hypothetical protein